MFCYLRNNPKNVPELSRLGVRFSQLFAGHAARARPCLMKLVNDVIRWTTFVSRRLTCEQLVVQQPDLLLEDLLLDSPQRALHLLPPSHHVGQVTDLKTQSGRL